MPALNFQKQFAAAVESGKKRQTIRAHRRDNRPHVLPGQTLKLYTGMRTKHCRLLATAECLSVEGISIHADGVALGAGPLNSLWLGETGSFIRRGMLEGMAIADGFTDWAAMRDWFQNTHGLPFRGSLIKWSLPRATGN